MIALWLLLCKQGFSNSLYKLIHSYMVLLAELAYLCSLPELSFRWLHYSWKSTGQLNTGWYIWVCTLRHLGKCHILVDCSIKVNLIIPCSSHAFGRYKNFFFSFFILNYHYSLWLVLCIHYCLTNKHPDRINTLSVHQRFGIYSHYCGTGNRAHIFIDTLFIQTSTTMNLKCWYM